VIHWIASADDPRLDPYRHVANPQWIRAHGLFVAESRLVVERLLSLDRFRLHSILVNRAAHDVMRPMLSLSDATVLACDDPTLESITGYNFHRGCLALVHRPADLAPAALFGSRRLLGIENVGNPDNIGGLFRTAAAFGVGGIILNATSGDPLYRKAIRTSMGASLRVPYAHTDEWLPALAQFRERGFKIAALTPSAAARSLSEVAEIVGKDDRLIVLVGAEGPGLDAGTIALADIAIRIPIDSAVDSLNVVVAAGIALHALGPAKEDSRQPQPSA
jgi:tRNA G18 (ribose-2'-O)-methylase SpoU